MRPVPHGITVTKRFEPTARDTAAAVGNVGVDAVATVALILWIEATCGELMAPWLEAGEASVGIRVAVDHTGPVFAGRPVDVHAGVTGVDGRKVSFMVRLEQGGREVMTGEHVRAVVGLERFLRGGAQSAGPAANRSVGAAVDSTVVSPAKPPVTFFFDVHSPWSYLASMLVGPLARRYGASILWRPIHLANLMDRIGGMRPLEQTRARVAWYEQDLADRMAHHGLPYDPHPDYPLRPSRALRSCVYAAERGCADAFVRAVMQGYWFEKKDISDMAVLQGLADAVGLGPAPLAEIAADEGYKRAVAANTDDAIASGVFGVPSFLFDGKLYFGSDRMDLLEAALRGWTG